MEFNLFNLGGLNFSGLKVEANLGARHGKGPSSLPVPLRTLGAAPSFLSCLSWHTRASRFVGRASELDALIRWCDHRSNLSLKFIRGDGGAGKSRLAAELALLLRKQGWSAGFLSDSNHEAVLGSNGKGALIIIDYPEEGPARLNAFLKRLRTVETQAKLRILCLSRQMPQAWEEVLSETGITDFVDTNPIMLAGVAMDDAYDLFTSAMEEIGTALDTAPKPVSTAAFESWFARDAFHANPLYLVAAAARAAFMPNEPSLSFAGQDAIRALARKEQDRMRRLAEARGLPSQAFVEIATGALLQEGLLKSDLTRFTNALADPFSLKLPDVTLDAISRTDDAGLIHFDMPDILAACFVAQALRASRNAGDLLWVASTLRPAPLERFARFASDAQLVLGDEGAAIVEAATANLENDERFASYLHGIGLRREQSIDPVLWPLWTSIHLKFADTADVPLLIVSALCNASVGLSNMARHRDAVEKLVRAKDILRTVTTDPRMKQQELANISLNLGRALAGLGQCDRAIRTLHDAIKYAERAARLARVGDDLAFYWEAQDTIALALDNIARSWGLLGKTERSVHFSRRACALADRKRNETGAIPTWAELNFKINLTSALALNGRQHEALTLLAAEEADIRSRSPGGRIDFALTMNLYHQAALANDAYKQADLTVDQWHQIAEMLDQAIAGADRMVAASPGNMLSLAVTARSVQADVLMKLDDPEGWVANQGAIYKLLVNRRCADEIAAGLAKVAAVTASILPTDSAERCFLEAMGATESARAAWAQRADVAVEQVQHATRDIWIVDHNTAPFIVL